MKIETKFTVGRQLPDMAGVYDLDECTLFLTMEGAVGDLLDRTTDTDLDIASDLQVLQCECDESNNVFSYEPVLSGAVVQTLVSMQGKKGA